MKIKLTNRASEELKKILTEKNAKNQKIRINLKGIGWGGPSFNLALDEQKDDDEIMEVEGMTFLVSKKLLSQFQNFTIDYSKFFLQRGFSIYANDHYTSGCA